MRDALGLKAGDKLTWEVDGRRVIITTERAALWQFAGTVDGGPDDPVRAVHEARRRRGRI